VLGRRSAQAIRVTRICPRESHPRKVRAGLCPNRWDCEGGVVKDLLQASVNVLPYRARYWIKHIPGLAASQRWLLRRFLEGQPFVHTVNAGPAAGLRFEIT